MINLTEAEAMELLGDKYTGPKPKKKHKYNAKKVELDGISFPSQHEAQYYSVLKLRVKAGEVEKFELQPVFVLQEGYMRGGKKVRAIKYIADFKVFYPDGRVEIVDTKGYRTRDYKNKIKTLLKQNPGMWFTEA